MRANQVETAVHSCILAAILDYMLLSRSKSNVSQRHFCLRSLYHICVYLIASLHKLFFLRGVRRGKMETGICISFYREKWAIF